MVWLVARYPKPPGTMIVLGSILKDPKNPESSLNLESDGAPMKPDSSNQEPSDKEPSTTTASTTTRIQRPSNVRDESLAVRATITSELSNNLSALLEVKAPGNPIVDAALKIHGDKSNSAETVVEAMNVRAEIFMPQKTYMDKALADLKVMEYINDGSKGMMPFSKKVYVIIGVSTAEKLNLKETLESNKSGGMSAEGSAHGSAKGKAEISGGKHGKTSIEREIEVDCDFAYRVREFIYSKSPFSSKGKWIEGKDVTDGTMYRDDAEGGAEEDEDGEYIPVFDNVKRKDETPEGMYCLRIPASK
ncbi:hypothetical protein GQ44DRAFT_694256 [Phaeosphaeriaceae sp. PMI808]|nr:hypothetical protein GQ44DRAFT_694256 [Phaeosphaeriaceae sp. PMI808]